LGVALWRGSILRRPDACWRSLARTSNPTKPVAQVGESGVSAELAGFAEDEQQRVGGCLAGDVVEIGAAEVPDTAGQLLLTHSAEPGSQRGRRLGAVGLTDARRLHRD
jgi:hypothetical protein